MAASVEGTFRLIDRASGTLDKIERNAIRTDKAIRGVGDALDSTQRSTKPAETGLTRVNTKLKDTEKQSDRTSTRYRMSMQQLERNTRNATNSATTDIGKLTAALNYLDKVKANPQIQLEGGASAVAMIRLVKRELDKLQREQAQAALGSIGVAGLSAAGAGVQQTTGFVSQLQGGIAGLVGRWGMMMGLFVAAIPVITSVVGVLGALASTVAMATAGAGALGVGGIVGFIGAVGLIAPALTVAMGALGKASDAWGAYNTAVETYGKNSKEAQKALKEFNRMKGPGADIVRQWHEIGDEYKRITRPTTRTIFQIMESSLRKISERWLPSIGRWTNRLFTGGNKEGLGIQAGIEGMFKVLNRPSMRKALDQVVDMMTQASPIVFRTFAQIARLFTHIAAAAKPFVIKMLDGIRDFFQDSANGTENLSKTRTAIGDLVSHLSKLWNLLKEIGKLMGAVFSAGAGPGADMVQSFTRTVRGARKDIEANPSALTGWFSEQIDRAGGYLDAAGGFATAVISLGEKIGELLDLLADLIKLLESILDKMPGDIPGTDIGLMDVAQWGGIGAVLGRGLQKVAPKIGNTIASQFPRAARAIFGKGVQEAAEKAVPRAGGGLLSRAFSGIGGVASRGAAGAAGAAGGAGGALKNFGGKFLKGFGRGGPLAFLTTFLDGGGWEGGAPSEVLADTAGSLGFNSGNVANLARRRGRALPGVSSSLQIQEEIATIQSLRDNASDFKMSSLTPENLSGLGAGTDDADWGPAIAAYKEINRLLRGQENRIAKNTDATDGWIEALGGKGKNGGVAGAVRNATNQVGKMVDKPTKSITDFNAMARDSFDKTEKHTGRSAEKTKDKAGSAWASLAGMIIGDNWDMLSSTRSAFGSISEELRKKLAGLTGSAVGNVGSSLPGGSNGNKNSGPPNRSARGGRIGGIGLQDTVNIGGNNLAAPGELIVNRHTERKINQKLGGRTTLGAEVAGENRPHWQQVADSSKRASWMHRHARGGRPMGGVEEPPGDVGSEVVQAGYGAAVGRFLSSYGMDLTQGYNPSGPSVSPGHLSLSAAPSLDVVPANGDWGGAFLDGLRYALNQGMNVLYGSRGVGTVIANHGEGNHAHIDWEGTTAGGLGAAAAGLTAAMGKAPRLRKPEGYTGRGSARRAMSGGAIDKLHKAAQGKLDKKFGAGAVGSAVGAAGGSLISWLTQALKITGHYSPANLEALKGRAMQESGGDPNIVNNWDSNAAAGTPSIGLLQTIGPTFDAYKMKGMGNITNPVHNAVAAIRYMMATYGHIVGPSSTGYATGGRIPWFGQGGNFVADAPMLMGVGDGGREHVSVTPAGKMASAAAATGVTIEHMEIVNNRPGDIRRQVEKELGEALNNVARRVERQDGTSSQESLV